MMRPRMSGHCRPWLVRCRRLPLAVRQIVLLLATSGEPRTTGRGVAGRPAGLAVLSVEALRKPRASAPRSRRRLVCLGGFDHLRRRRHLAGFESPCAVGVSVSDAGRR